MASREAAEAAVALRLAGSLALVFAGLCTLGLVALLLSVDDSLGQGYGSIIGAQLRSQAQLEVTLQFFGLLMAALAGVSTWLLALYTSFRIAGPVWRLSRNLEQAIAQGPVPPVPLRRDDLLQGEARALQDATAALEQHYAGLREVLVAWQLAPGPETVERVRAQLRALDAHVRL